MRLVLRSVVLTLLVASGLAGPRASTVSADAGGCGPAARPACTVLRAPAPARAAPGLGGPECVVLVGGLGSETQRDDHFFDPIVAPLRMDGGYRIIRFGLEPETLGHEYATYGAISENGESLRALVHDLSGPCRSIHVVAHSMGGAVADRAFSMGMSDLDGVATYLPLSSPHNGAYAARALRLGVDLDDTYASAASSLAERTRLHDPTSAAVRDLARIRPPRPPRGISTVRQRLVSDLVVIRRDNVDRRIDVREYLAGSGPELEGHGGVVVNARVQHVIERAIREHTVPSEERSPAEVTAAEVASRLADRYWAGLVGGVGLALGTVALGSAVGSGVRDAVDELAAGDPGGAAQVLARDAGRIARRVAIEAPVAIELGEAAIRLREGLPDVLAAQLVEAALK